MRPSGCRYGVLRDNMTRSVHLHIQKPALSPHSDPFPGHPPHQLVSGRQMNLSPCGTSQVLWQLITIIFEAFKHVVFKPLFIIECLLGHYDFNHVSPW
jgi:hypothetical protein